VNADSVAFNDCVAKFRALARNSENESLLEVDGGLQVGGGKFRGDAG